MKLEMEWRDNALYMCKVRIAYIYANTLTRWTVVHLFPGMLSESTYKTFNAAQKAIEKDVTVWFEHMTGEMILDDSD